MAKKIEDPAILEQLEQRGIDAKHIVKLYNDIISGAISDESFIIPKEQLTPPKDSDYIDYNNPSLTISENQIEKLNTTYGLSLANPLSKNDLRTLGLASIKKGELALFWLNGGAATRYYNMKKVKENEKERFKDELHALTEDLLNKPKGVTPVIRDMTYLELKVKNLIHIQKEAGVEKPIPVILMNSFITDEETTKHFHHLYEKYSEIKSTQFHKVIQQPTIPRWTLTKNRKDIDLYTDEKGKLSYAPSGHGDFLQLLKEFFSKNTLESKYLFFANIDNFGSTVDPVILGIHIAKENGRTVELAPKKPGDKGGAPCFVNNKLIIVEQMKFPEDFDQDQISAFNTNTFWFTIQDLLAYNQELPLIIAEKTIGNVEVMQLEHFACDVNLPSTFVNAPRKNRFWPTKRYVDLLIFRDPHPQGENEAAQHKEFQALMQNEYDISID